jgi:hypothetical protein
MRERTEKMLELSGVQLPILIIVRQVKLRFHKADKFVFGNF